MTMNGLTNFKHVTPSLKPTSYHALLQSSFKTHNCTLHAQNSANTLCELNAIFNLKQAVHTATKLLKGLTQMQHLAHIL
jgi:hypothetical protein